MHFKSIIEFKSLIFKNWIFLVLIFKRYNVCLIGLGTLVKKNRKAFINELTSRKFQNQFKLNKYLNYTILLNPGDKCILSPEDICLYISVFDEKKFNLKYTPKNLCKFFIVLSFGYY